MLNLSDNELDRLSREAASQHDPGDLLGPQSWERLELRLEKELGRAGPDMSRGMRGFRRLPFQYAPVILLIVGVSYYFVKTKGRKTESSGSPPMTVTNTPLQQPGVSSDPSLKNPAYSDKSTSTLYPGTDAPSGSTTGTPASSASGSSPAEGRTASGPNSEKDHGAAGSHNTPAGAGHAAPGVDNTTPGPASTSSGPGNAASGLGSSSSGVGGTASRPGNKSSGQGNAASRVGKASSGQGNTASGLGNTAPGPDNASSGLGNTASGQGNTAPGLGNTASGQGNAASGLANTASNRGNNSSGLKNASSTPGSAASSGRKNSGRPTGKSGKDMSSQNLAADYQTAGQAGKTPSAGQASQTPSAEPSGPYHVYIQRPFTLRSQPRISDSALRAYAAQLPKDPAKQAGPSLHINRSLTLGLQIAPDFTSVNALAGDKPGSSLGLTVDYQFLNRWHIGTGFFYTRKNYTARSMDYHVPYNYYRMNNMKEVDFVKGTMTMLEIPLTIRYDFSVTGNTIFFASTGVSSYLLGKEHSSYYFDFFGREACRDFRYSNTPNGLFTSVNLSLGVETGLSNSISVLVAPYMKLPTGDIGFGKVKMNSVGIHFAIRYAPVLGRKRNY